jgi:hypothetical protein
MSTPQTKRQILGEYTEAARNIEMTGMAIDILDRLRFKAAQTAIRTLRREQQRQLVKLDRAAAALGAPYGGKS